MAKKIKLEYKPSEDYKFICISCQLKDYRLCFHLNKKLGFDFKKIQDFETPNGKKNKKFSLYFFDYLDNQVYFFLIANKNLNDVLISELKHMDYFILIHGAINDKKSQTFINEIKKIPQILMANEINPDKIKSANNLFSDLELHLMQFQLKEKNADCKKSSIKTVWCDF